MSNIQIGQPRPFSTLLEKDHTYTISKVAKRSIYAEHLATCACGWTGTFVTGQMRETYHAHLMDVILAQLGIQSGPTVITADVSIGQHDPACAIYDGYLGRECDCREPQ